MSTPASPDQPGSPHTPSHISPAGDDASAAPASSQSDAAETATANPTITPTVLRPSREHLLGALVMFLMCLMFTGHDPKLLFWVPFIPLLFVVWTLRVRTVISPAGITGKYLFRKSQHVAWEDFQSLRFSKGGRGYAVGKTAPGAKADETQIWLPGVTFNSLVDLSKATGGLIPDPVTPGRAATHEKVQVVHKDGYAVLMDVDEYKQYEAQRRREAGVVDEPADEKRSE